MDDHLPRLFMIVIGLIIYITIIYFSFKTISSIKEIVYIRSKNVTLLQNLIVVAERGDLIKELELIGIEGSLQLFSLLRAFRIYRHHPSQWSSNIPHSEALDVFLYGHSNHKGNERSARNFLTDGIFDIFFLIFYMYACYFVVFAISLFM